MKNIIFILWFLAVFVGCQGDLREDLINLDKEHYYGVLAEPNVSVAEGVYNEIQYITLTHLDTEAAIYYTLDNTSPQCGGSTLYAETITVDKSLTLKAIACRDRWEPSSVVSVSYQLQVGDPQFTPVAGNYNSAQNVSIVSATSSAQIYYTLNGTDPACGSGSLYSAAIPVTSTTTIKAIACRSDLPASNLVSSVYNMPKFLIKGTISGLEGSGFKLQNNTGEQITISADGAFSFATSYYNTQTYTVSVAAQPTNPWQTCSVANGTGTMGSADVTNVVVTCTTNTYRVGGTISGLSGQTVVLLNNNIDATSISANGTFSMNTSLLSGRAYNVTVQTVTGGYACNATSNTGAVGSADVTTVSVVCATAQTISGTIVQSSGGITGTKVFVRLYNDVTKFIPIQEIEYSVSSGSNATGINYSFDVAPGTYYIHAYRDENNDGEPTLAASNSDPQSVLTGPISTFPDTRILTLTDTSNKNEHDYFQVFAYNETFMAQPPYYEYPPSSGTWVAGNGLCGGFRMSMEVQRKGGSLFAGFKVLLPNLDVKVPLDDGGCSQTVHDNTSSSYDDNNSDGKFKYGIKDPTLGSSSVYAGDYYLFYLTTGYYIHRQKNFVPEVVKLARSYFLSVPAHTSAEPTITWRPITTTASGDIKYNLRLYDNGGPGTMDYADLNKFDLSSNSYTISSSESLSDDRIYSIAAITYLQETASQNIYAASVSQFNQFIIDLSGDSSVAISGTVTNNTGLSGQVFAFVEGGNGERITVPVDGSGNFSFRVFTKDDSACGGKPCGKIVGFVDTQGSYDRETNRMNSVEKKISLGADLSGISLVINPSVILYTPMDFANNTGNQPTFDWADYNYTGGGSWCYAVYVQKESSAGGMPEIVWSLPPGQTDYNMVTPPATKFDLVDLANGGDGTGSSATPSLLDLSLQTDWHWGVVIIECAYNDETCLTSKLSSDNFWAQSADRKLKTTP